MKNLILVFGLIFAGSLFSCNGVTEQSKKSDSIDTIMVDSVAVDTVVADSL